VVILPALVQQFVVVPSKLALETPCLKNDIRSTGEAYDPAPVQATSCPALADLTPSVMAHNHNTIENIRLWDERPLLQTDRQTQAIRLYCEFDNVGADRGDGDRAAGDRLGQTMPGWSDGHQ
jgi:hypothetical protein